MPGATEKRLGRPLRSNAAKSIRSAAQRDGWGTSTCPLKSTSRAFSPSATHKRPPGPPAPHIRPPWSPSRTKSASCTARSSRAQNGTHHTHAHSVHDGWGIAPEPNMKGDAISAGTTTNMDTIAKEHSVRTLHAHGISVGLSDGLMGNSEVGYVSCRSPAPPRADSPQAPEHRRGAHRLAGHRQDRRLDQEAPVPQERGHPRELQAGEGGKRPPAPPRSGAYRTNQRPTPHSSLSVYTLPAGLRRRCALAHQTPLCAARDG